MGNTEVKRKAIPKRIRQKVYEKYNCHCAYCGGEGEYKEIDNQAERNECKNGAKVHSVNQTLAPHFHF